MGKGIPICNCNAVGDRSENMFYSIIRDAFGQTFEFDQKVLMKQPGFDICNFISYDTKLCEDDGVYKKIFKTKYLIFE